MVSSGDDRQLGILHIIPVALLGAAFAWTSWNIWRYGVNIPFQDGWEFFYTYLALKTGTFGLSNLTAAHNEHRVFVPVALLTLNALVFDWNIKVTLFLSAFLALLTAWILIRLASATLKQRTFDYLIISGVVIIQVFNMAQFANWLWEWDFQWFIVNMGAICALSLLFIATQKKAPTIYVGLAALSSFAASFSLGSGLCLWPLGLAYLLIETKLRRFAVGWLVASVGVFYLYFHGLAASTNPPPPALVDWLPMVGEFTARLLGSTLDNKFLWGGVLIIVGVATTLVCLCTESKRSRALPWIAMAAYAGGGALTAALTRAHWLGAQEGSQTRYSTIAGIFVIAITVIVIIAASGRLSRFAALTFVAVVMAQSVIHYPGGYDGFLWLSKRLAEGRECLMTNSPDDDCVGKLYYPQNARERWQKLRELNWQATRQQPATIF